MASSNTTWGPPAPRRSLVLCHLPCPLSPHSLAYLEKMYQEQRWLAPQDVPWPSLVTYRNSLQPQEERGSVNSRSTAPRPPPGSAAKRPRIDGEVGAEPGGGGTPHAGGHTTPSTPTALCRAGGGLALLCPSLWGPRPEAGTGLRLPSTDRGSLWGRKLRDGGGGGGWVTSVLSPLPELDCPRVGTRTGLKDGDRLWGWGHSSGIGSGDGVVVPVLSPLLQPLRSTPTPARGRAAASPAQP